MIAFLFRHRDRLLGLWGIGFLVLAWPPRGMPSSLFLLVGGITLRLWARAHIGPHSRGRNLSAPMRCTGGPYAFLAHPLYVANLLVVAGLALQIAGLSLATVAALAGPTLLYALLGRAESRHLRETSPPDRFHPLPWAQRRMASEWASLLPPLVLWLALGALAP